MISSSEVKRWIRLAETIAKALKERSGYEFKPKIFMEPFFRWACEREKPKYPVKSSDGKELGLMFINADLKHVYFDARRKIKWPDDWIDPYPPFIDSVWSDCRCIRVERSGKMDLRFMATAYYCVNLYSGWESLKREDLQKVSRFMPMVVKDMSKFMRLADETFSKYEIDKSEFRITFFNRLSCELSFEIGTMSDDEIIENVLKRSEALAKLERKFNEWLVSEERKVCYERTMVFPDDIFRWACHIPSAIGSEESRPFWRKYEGPRFLCKWPFKSGNDDMDKKYEWELKRELWNAESFRYYDLDGRRLRLAKKTKTGFRYLGRVDKKGWIKIDKSRVREEDLSREDIVIAVDKGLERLPKFSLEKIEFLKEDFPEMFK